RPRPIPTRGLYHDYDRHRGRHADNCRSGLHLSQSADPFPMSMSEVSSIETKTAVAELRAGRWGALRQLAKLRESPIGMLGLALVAGWIIIALLAPLIAPFPP